MTFEEDIKNALAALRKGGVILYPTDTVWGLGCDAADNEAVERLFEIKKRSASKSMLVLVDSEGMLDRYVDEIPEVAWQLVEAAVNPLTIVYDRPHGVSPRLLAPDGSLGIRITGERYSRELVKRLRHPLVSTSANISGEKTPLHFCDIPEEVKESVDYIAEWRRDDLSDATPSNIIKVSAGGVVKVIR